ncbi:unnamed protein product, partial [Effrenium voratum]
RQARQEREREDFDPLPRMAAIYGLAELCGVGHRKAGATISDTAVWRLAQFGAWRALARIQCDMCDALGPSLRLSASESASAMKGGERGIEGERGEGERSCTSRLTQMGREALLRALVQLEALEAMLPKEPQKPMPSDPCHDRFIRRHWKKLQKFPPPASWETRPRASRKRAAS